MIQKYIKNIRLFDILFESVDFRNNTVKKLYLVISINILSVKKSALDLQINYESFFKAISKDSKAYFKNKIYLAIFNEWFISKY